MPRKPALEAAWILGCESQGLEMTLPREGIETLLPGLLPELDAVVDGITPARGRKPFSESFFYYNGVWL